MYINVSHLLGVTMKQAIAPATGIKKCQLLRSFAESSFFISSQASGPILAKPRKPKESPMGAIPLAKK